MRVKHEKVPCYARSYPRAIPPVPNPGDNSFLTAYSLKRREFSQSPHGLSMAKLDSVQECFFLFDRSITRSGPRLRFSGNWSPSISILLMCSACNCLNLAEAYFVDANTRLMVEEAWGIEYLCLFETEFVKFN